MDNVTIAKKGYYIVGQKWTKEGLSDLQKRRPDLLTWKQYTLIIDGKQAESVRAESYRTAKKAFEALFYLDQAEGYQILTQEQE